MIHRFIHQQNGQQDILVDDLEDGTGTDKLARFRRHNVYIPYNRKYFDGNGNLVEDTSTAGFLDLPLTSDVELSLEGGTLKGLKDDGLVSEVTYSPSDTEAPSITSAEHDDDAGSTEAFEVAFTISDGTGGATGDYTITINGTAHTETDSNGNSDESSTLATNLASAIDSGSESSVVSASASGSTVTVTSDVLETPFTYSSSTTDAGGSITETVTHTGKVIINGERFTSISPFSTVITLTDTGNTSVDITESDISGDANSKLDQTVIVISASLHGLGNTSGDVDEVTVRANDKTDSSAVASLS